MQITLRPATENDKDFCRQVHHLAYHDAVERQFGLWDEQQQDGFFAEAWEIVRLLVIEADGYPVGCFCCETQQDRVDLIEISLLPSSQGNGIGTQLISNEQGNAARLGLPIYLRVLKENRAKNLYQRLGFRKIGEDTTHYLMKWTRD